MNAIPVGSVGRRKLGRFKALARGSRFQAMARCIRVPVSSILQQVAAGCIHMSVGGVKTSVKKHGPATVMEFNDLARACRGRRENTCSRPPQASRYVREDARQWHHHPSPISPRAQCFMPHSPILRVVCGPPPLISCLRTIRLLRGARAAKPRREADHIRIPLRYPPTLSPIARTSLSLPLNVTH